MPYDQEKAKTLIQYLDANNLYGWAMSQKLPIGGFEWTNPTTDEVIQTPDDSDEGYIIEVDLEYLKELHDLHNDYPLAPEEMAIKQEYWANTSRNSCTNWDANSRVLLSWYLTYSTRSVMCNIIKIWGYIMHWG